MACTTSTGDGQPEVIGLINNNGTRAYVVSQLRGGTAPRTPEAGRLTAIDNGFGANTQIKYQSAKEDRYSAHQVPFPEIGVASVETVGNHGLGGTLAGVRYAYGQPELVFDGALDAFTFTGYRRFIEVYPYGLKRAEAFAVITDTWPTTSVQVGTKQQRWARYARGGRVRDIYTLRGSTTTDPWSLLGVTPSDTRVIGVTHQEWDAKFYEEPTGGSNWARLA